MAIRIMVAAWGVFLATVFAVGVPITSAQVLHIVTEETTTISDPGVYRAFYGALNDRPQVFSFTTNDSAFPLFLTILVPDTDEAASDIRVEVVDSNQPETTVASADGALIEWTRFFDTAGRNWYLAGPSLQRTVPAGTYSIRVSSARATPYVLVFQGEETFSLAKIFGRFSSVPKIKSQFFHSSPIAALGTPLLLVPLLIALTVVAFVLSVFVYRRFRAE